VVILSIKNAVIGETVLQDLQGFLVQQQLYSAAIKEIRTKLEILDEEFKVKYDHNPIHHIESRLKTPESIIKKLQKRNMEISLESIRQNLTDVAGIRVICNYIDDIYQISDMLTSQNDIRLLSMQDYISNPKESGYRSLHLVVEVPIFLSNQIENVPAEIQIRTIAMDFWASLEHHLKYKSDKAIAEDLWDRLKNCADAIYQVDSEMQAIYHAVKGAEEN